MTKLSFYPLNAEGPKTCHHVGVVIKNKLYTHGGLEVADSTHPLNNLFRFSFDSLTWTDLTTSSSPFRSKHAAVAMDNRYLVLIGGWNGRHRIGGVSVYDTEEDKWLDVTTLNFPERSGLSGHTANMQEDGRILVIGRLGGATKSERYCSIFTLLGWIKGSKAEFKYNLKKQSASSRSGHICSIVQGHALVVGGRKWQLVEAKKLETRSGVPRDICSLNFLQKISQNGDNKNQLKKIVSHHVPEAKNHSGLLCDGGNSLLTFGGWNFNGMYKQPSSHVYLLTFTPPYQIQWYDLGASNLPSSGHIMVTNGNKVYVHGGEGMNKEIRNTIFEMKQIKSSESKQKI